MKRFRGSKKAGQSLPLLAVLIVVIVAAVGLSVDVGNAYGQQRRLQNISNAGALAGMSSVIAGQTNQGVCDNVQRTLAGNKVSSSVADGAANNGYVYHVDYVFKDPKTGLDDPSQTKTVCQWNGSRMINSSVLDMTAQPPKNMARVQVTMKERVDTYFARVAGRSDFNLQTNGSACFGGFSTGVYPIGIPLTLTKGFHKIYRAQSGSEIPTNTTSWGQWDKMLGLEVYLPVTNWNGSNPGTHISWLDWTPGGGGANDLDAALTFPGTLASGFVEADSPDGSKPNSLPLRELYPSDWVDGKTGTVASASSALQKLVNPPGMSEPRDLILPMYSDAVGNGSKTAFYVRQMGAFRLVSFDLNGNNKYLRLQYLGKADVSPEECSSQVDDPGGPPPRRFNIDGETVVNRVYRTKVSSNKTHDIIVVMDTSGSMANDWNDIEPGKKVGSTRFNYSRIEDAKKAVVDFVRNYDIRDDPEARMAFVTFSGTGTNSARVEVGWSCADGRQTSNCSGTLPDLSTTTKWSAIQAKATAMRADGYTPGPIAFEKVEQLLQNKRTPRAGQEYGQIVVFATDGVFNVCGAEKGVQKCTHGQLVGNTTQAIYSAPYNLESGRPVWQAQRVAQRIKSTGAQVFVIGLTPTCLAGDADCFDPAGLADMSSGSGYYYLAKDPAAMESIYRNIAYKIDGDTCRSVETEQAAEGASMVLRMPGNPTWSLTDVADSAGKWRFTNLESGTYVVTVSPDLKVRSPEPEDGLWRTYSRLQNELKRSEIGQATVIIDGQRPNGATETASVRLLMPLDPQGAPYNACNSGTLTK